MAFTIRFNEEKNQLLKATRGVGFEDILDSIREGELLADLTNSSKHHPSQKLYVVRLRDYAYAVPYVMDLQKQEIFLKTLYPSRVLTKKYIQGGSHAR